MRSIVEESYFEAMIDKVISDKTTWYGTQITDYRGKDGRIYTKQVNFDQIPSVRYFVEEV